MGQWSMHMSREGMGNSVLSHSQHLHCLRSKAFWWTWKWWHREEKTERPVPFPLSSSFFKGGKAWFNAGEIKATELVSCGNSTVLVRIKCIYSLYLWVSFWGLFCVFAYMFIQYIKKNSNNQGRVVEQVEVELEQGEPQEGRCSSWLMGT